MSTPYIGEIRIFAGNFAPVGWLFCQGQLLPIDQYDVLFNLIGTTYGGDGQTTFALPNNSGAPIRHSNGNTALNVLKSASTSASIRSATVSVACGLLAGAWLGIPASRSPSQMRRTASSVSGSKTSSTEWTISRPGS